MSLSRIELELPRWSRPLFEPARYKIIKGGRAAAKSYTVAQILLLKAMKKPTRVLCGREFQASIAESVHSLLADRIQAMGLDGFYRVYKNAIVGANGSRFFFAGLRHNITSIKSMANVDIFWGEEAHTFSEETYKILLPTIREEGSEIWLTLNPELPDDPSSVRFIENPPPGAVSISVTYRDNPFISQTALDERARDEQLLLPDDYAWVWEGEYRVRSNSRVLADKIVIEDFTPEATWDGPYFGLDFGFSQDPTASVKLWISGERLFVEHEAGGVGIDIDKTAPLLKETMPGIERHRVEADCARPESISYLRRHGLPRIVGAKKWPGSIEDGITYLRSFRQIVIHPRCKGTARNAKLYSYKVDRLSGEPLDVIIDAENDYIDAMRYALVKIIRNRKLVYRKVASV